MIPRGRLDYGWPDLAAGLIHCVLPGGRSSAAARVAELSVGTEGFVCLSVRSGLDLLLTELDLPRGSEVLVSAVTIRDMVRIIEEHGLVPVPVDVDMDSLTLDLDSLRAAIGPGSRALLVAHLFGSRMDIGPVAAVARAHDLVLIEDCAQSYIGDGYWGHPESDVTLTSFGPIKSASALGGAVARVRSGELRMRLERRQAAYPVQGRWWFAKRVLRFALVRALMYRLPFALFHAACRLLGRSHDDVFSQSIRGFGDDRLFWKIRHQPGYPLLALLARRIRHFGGRQIERRVAVAREADTLMADVPRPGRTAKLHTNWVYPVLAPDPDALAEHLWRNGFDATRGRWSLYVVQAPEHRPSAHAEKANAVMSRVLYLPVYPAAYRHLWRLAATVNEFFRAVTPAPVAVVTGAASGIGRHWAGALQRRGYRLALVDVNEGGLRSAFAPGEDVRLHTFDVRSAAGWKSLVEDTLERFGRIDYLFNIAGGGRPGFLLDVPLELVDTTIDVNLKAQIYGMKAVAPAMVERGSGHIVNVSSLAGISPTPGNELYSAAKSGLRSVSLSTAVRLRPHGVHVSVLCPDLVDTPTVDRHLKLDPTDVALIYSGPGALPLERVEEALWRIVRDRPLEMAVPGSRGWLVKIVNAFPELMPRLYGTLLRRGLERLEVVRRERALRTSGAAAPTTPLPAARTSAVRDTRLA